MRDLYYVHFTGENTEVKMTFYSHKFTQTETCRATIHTLVCLTGPLLGQS